MSFLALLADSAVALAAVALFGRAAGQIFRPWQPPIAGAVSRRVRLPLRARVRLHGVWLLGVTLILLVALSLGLLVTPWPFLVAAVAAVALLLLPVSYTVTDHGFAVGRTTLRRWTEFGGVSARGGWIYLQPVTGAKGVLVRVPDRATGDDLAAECRRLMRAAYKGQIGPYRGTLEAIEWSAPADDDGLPTGVGATA
jgi:hypothetical protein